MNLFASHRANTLPELHLTPPLFGVEMDVHSYGDRLVVHHEPMEPGVDLEVWLKHFRHAFLIMNVKEEGIEERLVRILAEHSIENYFLLDLSFHRIVDLAQKGFRKMSIRLSKYESVETVMAMAGMADWIWLDLFDDQIPVSQKQWQKLKELNFRICLASPELRHRGKESVAAIQNQLSAMGVWPDGICGKDPNLWLAAAPSIC